MAQRGGVLAWALVVCLWGCVVLQVHGLVQGSHVDRRQLYPADPGSGWKLFATPGATNCAEDLAYGPLPITQAGSDEARHYLSTLDKHTDHNSWLEIVTGDGDTTLFTIQWDFAETKTLAKRFEDAVSFGERVNYTVTDRNGGVVEFKNTLWRFSSTSGVTVSRFDGSGSSFSDDDGAWGAGSGSVDGEELWLPSDFWGLANADSNDAASCPSLYQNGVTSLWSSNVVYMYLNATANPQWELFATPGGNQCAEDLAFGPLPVTEEGSSEATHYLSTVNKDKVHDSWLQIMTQNGEYILFTIQWKFAERKSLAQRFADAVVAGEVVDYTVTLRTGEVIQFNGATWRFSSAAALTELTFDGSGSGFSADEGAWGGGSGTIDAFAASLPANFYGIATANEGEGWCKRVYEDGALTKYANNVALMYLFDRADGTKERCHMQLESKGNSNSEGQWLYVDISSVRDPRVDSDARGIHLVQLDPETCEITNRRFFDTHGSAAASETLLAALQGLGSHEFVLLGCQNSCEERLSDAVKNEICTRLGGCNIDSMGYKQPYALISFIDSTSQGVQICEEVGDRGTAVTCYHSFTVSDLAPTASPSIAPTTSLPSPAPTTPVPSSTPTLHPTASPTSIPTPLPSPAPTTFMPSPFPSLVPSASPSPIPTSLPTAEPSYSPSQGPTTPMPSLLPMPRPSGHPSPSPTPAPTPLPTSAPTAHPSLSPTPAPTPLPTSAPTAHPSPSPTPAPTPLPTSAPTVAPTTPMPSPYPTWVPSFVPTVSPSSSTPTPAPSTLPSPAPSGAPTSFENGIAADVSTSLVLTGVTVATFGPDERQVFKGGMYLAYDRMRSPEDVVVNTVTQAARSTHFVKEQSAGGVAVEFTLSVTEASKSNITEFTRTIATELATLVNESSSPQGLSNAFQQAAADLGTPTAAQVDTAASRDSVSEVEVSAVRVTRPPTAQPTTRPSQLPTATPTATLAPTPSPTSPTMAPTTTFDKLENRYWIFLAATIVFVAVALGIFRNSMPDHQRKRIAWYYLVSILFSYADFAGDVMWIHQRFYSYTYDHDDESLAFGQAALVVLLVSTFIMGTSVVLVMRKHRSMLKKGFQEKTALYTCVVLLSFTDPDLTMFFPWAKEAYPRGDSAATMPNPDTIRVSLLKSVEDLPQLIIQITYFSVAGWTWFTAFNFFITVGVLLHTMSNKIIVYFFFSDEEKQPRPSMLLRRLSSRRPKPRPGAVGRSALGGGGGGDDDQAVTTGSVDLRV